MADPVLYGYKILKGAAAASQTIDLTTLLDPSGAALGPALGGQFTVVHIIVGHTTNRNPAATGYTVVMDGYATDTQGTALWVGHKFQPSTPDTSITITASGSSGSSLIAIATVWDNVDPTTPLDGVATVNLSTANTALPDPGSITPATTGAVILFGAGNSHVQGVQALSESYMDWSVQDSRDGTNDASALVGYVSGGVAATPYDGAALTWAGTDGTTLSNCSNVMVLRPTASSSSTGTSAGVATATAASVGSGASAGVATASAGQVSSGTASGTATAVAEVPAAVSVGTSAGTSTATAASVYSGTSAGTATASANPVAKGTSAGVATATAVEASTASTGTSAGTSTATAASVSSGTIAGVATASANPVAKGTSAGVATAAANPVTKGTTAGVATAAAKSVSLGTSAGVATATAASVVGINYGIIAGSSTAVAASVSSGTADGSASAIAYLYGSTFQYNDVETIVVPDEAQLIALAFEDRLINTPADDSTEVPAEYRWSGVRARMRAS